MSRCVAPIAACESPCSASSPWPRRLCPPRRRRRSASRCRRPSAFQVTDVSRSTSGSAKPDDAQLLEREPDSRQGLRVSVQADAAAFTPPSGASIPASKVSWTTLGASGGTGWNGTLGSSSYALVFQSDPGQDLGARRSGMDAGGARQRHPRRQSPVDDSLEGGIDHALKNIEGLSTSGRGDSSITTHRIDLAEREGFGLSGAL